MTSAIDEQPNKAPPRARLPRRLGLSGKLLLLTIPLVIYVTVDSTARFWGSRQWLSQIHRVRESRTGSGASATRHGGWSWLILIDRSASS